MFALVIVFICAMHIHYDYCNEDSARAVIVLPEDSGCFDAQATLANLAIDFDRDREYIKVLCKGKRG